MQVFHTPQQAQTWCQQQRNTHKRIGFVATMGALHDGHIALIKRARKENDIVCASIFVNPLQFNRKEDLLNYPRTFEADTALLKAHNCDMVFTGDIDDFFPNKDEKTKALPIKSQAAQGLEAEYRPGHFEGVWKIVEKLFYVVGDCNAYFGEKDFQQVMLVKELANYLAKPTTQNTDTLNVNIIPCQTLRDKNGLALSSRNMRLTSEQRQQALVIYKTLQAAVTMWRSGQRNADVLENFMYDTLKDSPLKIEYAAVRDPDNWQNETPKYPLKKAQALIAGYIGEVRLIDNMALHV